MIERGDLKESIIIIIARKDKMIIKIYPKNLVNVKFCFSSYLTIAVSLLFEKLLHVQSLVCFF